MTTRRLLPLSGIGFVALVALGVALGGSTPGSTATGAQVASYYDVHQARLVAVSFVLAAAGLFIVLFAVALARRLSPAGEHGGVWDRVLVGGSIMFAAACGLVGSVNFAIGDSPSTISHPALQALNVLVNDTWVFWNGAMGVFMLGAAGVWVASARAPRWLGRIAIVLGVALFIPFADFFAFLASGLWIVATSVLLFNTTSREPAPAAAPSVA